ncbi:nuclear transport factor 2 family protein [Rhizobium giardinii]|uniref:nuclear transport factor 2 family protein n=1 Tax=Rhizobium giardinii TaxID=56731 RepID=UPI003D6EB860
MTISQADLLRTIEHARLRALVSADVVQAQQLHAPDFQLITPIGAVLSKDDYLGAIASGHIKYLVWEPADIDVRLYQGGAAMRYRAKLEVAFGGHKVPLSDYWHTDIYEDRDGQWMIVWSQATAIR